MQQYSTYLFDFDGTIVDSHDSLVKVFEDSYASVGVKVPNGYVLRLMRIPLFQGYAELHAPEDEASKKRFGDMINQTLDAPEVLKLTKTYDDALKSLYALKARGARLGIVTSNNVKHVREVLRFVNMPEDLFEVIIGNGDTKVHKPNPDPIYKALERLGIDREGVCYVGDALQDFNTAINAKVEPILLDRHHEYDDVEGIKIYSLEELL